MKKKMLMWVFSAVFAVSLLVTGKKVQAETYLGDYLKDMGIEVDISATLDFYDKYVWRGFLLDDDPVLQPSATLSIGPFSGGFWGSWDVNPEDALNSDEVDGWVAFNFDLGFISEEMAMVGFSVGNTWYHFPNGDTGLAGGAHTEEMFVTVTLDTFLSPYFTWFHDYGDEESGGADGNYFHVGIGHSFTLLEEYGVTADLGYEFGYNDEAFIADDGGYNLLKLGLSIPISEKVTVTPKVAYSMPFGDIDDANNDEVYGGVSISFAM